MMKIMLMILIACGMVTPPHGASGSTETEAAVEVEVAKGPRGLTDKPSRYVKRRTWRGPFFGERGAEEERNLPALPSL